MCAIQIELRDEYLEKMTASEYKPIGYFSKILSNYAYAHHLSYNNKSTERNRGAKVYRMLS